MGYYDKDEPEVVEPPAPSLLDRAEQAVSLLVRLLGMGMLLFGLVVAVTVIREGWALYQQPERVERFAIAIERGSNLDAVFARVASDEKAVDEQPADAAAGRPSPRSLRLSYFAAWFVVLALLMVVGGLAVSAIGTGGQLAVRDVQVRRHARAAAREASRLRRVA